MNIYAKILSNDWLNEAALKRLKAELRSESWQKHARAENSGKLHFSAPTIFLPSFRQAGLPRHSRCGDGGSHRVAVSRSDLQRQTWLAGPVRPSSTKKINPKVWAVSEKSPGCRNRFRMWSNRDRFVAPSCPHSPRRRGKPLRQRRVKPRSGLDRVSPHRNLSANTVK